MRHVAASFSLVQLASLSSVLTIHRMWDSNQIVEKKSAFHLGWAIGVGGTSCTDCASMAFLPRPVVAAAPTGRTGWDEWSRPAGRGCLLCHCSFGAPHVALRSNPNPTGALVRFCVRSLCFSHISVSSSQVYRTIIPVTLIRGLLHAGEEGACS